PGGGRDVSDWPCGQRVVEIPRCHEDGDDAEEGVVAGGLPGQIRAGGEERCPEQTNLTAAAYTPDEAEQPQSDGGEVSEQVGVPDPRNGDEVPHGPQLADRGAIKASVAQRVDLRERQR